MKKLPPFRIALFVFSLLLTSFSAFGQAGLVISQVYGGGGNNGAMYTNDFIELYNPTNSSLDTSGLSIQYASKTGTFTTGANVEALPAAAIAPGHYFLIQAAKGTGGTTALPTPDASVTLALSGTDGKVALVNGSSALGTNGCPLPNANIIDFVGYGAADCAEGGAAAPVLSNTTAAIRTNPAVDTDNNAADFAAGTPNPHNSSYVTSTNTLLSATGSANPATILAGNQAVLTVTVTPGTNPPSTNIAASADLSLIGGSKTQAFTDNGDGTFSFTATVTTSSTGSISLPVAVTDSEGDTALTNIALTVNQPAPQLAISQIQGAKSTTAEVVSPYAGQAVQTSGIVTAITSTGFIIQTPGNGDGNPLTPEGIYVYTGSGKVPASVAIGNSMQVTGTAATFPTLVNSHIPSTELEAPLTITQLSTGNPLPAPIQLTAANVSPTGSIYQLTPYEGMRVSFASLTTTSGTDGSLNETNEVYTSNGEFYAVITGTPRPFRKPGIDLRDPVVDPTKQPAVFNDSPERIFVDSGFLVGSTPINLSTGAILPNVTGVLDFSDSYDDNYVPARLLLDPAYNTANIIPGMTIQPVPLPASGEFTVASFNIERFFNTNSADDLYYVPAGVTGYNGSSSKGTISTGQTFESEAVDVTSAAYATRLKKLSLAIRTVLNMPDVVTLEEVENQSVANDIASQINTDAGIPGLYTAFSTDNSTYYSQDGTGISVGFLVKNTVDELGFTQFGQGDTYTTTGSSTPITLNDRPWLVLNAGIKRAGAKDYPVTVIVNHMKSLINVNSTTTSSTRQKKELQAEDIAKYIQTLQASGQHVISGGDFNAFEFSDGYTDTLATYTNTNVLPAAQVVQPGVPNLVNPPLVDMALLLPPDQRWSYQEYGDAQILDHMVVTPELASAGAHLTYVHLNADFPLTSYSDPTTPARVSDHDAALGYFALPAPVLSATLTPPSADFGANTVGVASSGQVFTLTNTGEGTISITSVTATGDYAATSACGPSLDTATATCTINVVLTATAAGIRTGMLTVATSGGTYTSQLTGTGALLSDFTIGGSTGTSNSLVSVLAGASANVPLTFTPVGLFNGTITITCATASGASPAGVTCTAPAPFPLSGSAKTVNVGFSTSSNVAASGFALAIGKGSRGMAILSGAIILLLMLLVARSRRLAQTIGLLSLILIFVLPMVGCGHSSNSSATPAGTYSYTITATSGSISHTETITLIVQ